MFESINLPVILMAAFLATASPGPATLAIAGTSMSQGRRKGLAMAAGITSGSWIWSVSAALGLGAVMLAHAWAIEIIRYVGACYLLYLAFKSARSALSSQPLNVGFASKKQTMRSAYSLSWRYSLRRSTELSTISRVCTTVFKPSNDQKVPKDATVV